MEGRVQKEACGPELSAILANITFLLSILKDNWWAPSLPLTRGKGPLLLHPCLCLGPKISLTKVFVLFPKSLSGIRNMLICFSLYLSKSMLENMHFTLERHMILKLHDVSENNQGSCVNSDYNIKFELARFHLISLLQFSDFLPI